MSGRFSSFIVLSTLLSLLYPFSASNAARVKDIAFVEGVRSNQLVGYGLVVGLNGTGDKSSSVFTMQSVGNMLNRLGLKLDPKDIKVKNTAAVLLTAELPPFVKPGSRIDVLASSIGDASSLQGGTLVSSALKGPDGFVYAVAQGPVALAGYSAGSSSSKTKNHQTAAKITGGALIEKEVPMSIFLADEFSILLRNPDFTTAERLAMSINTGLNAQTARPVDAGRIRVAIPPEHRASVVEYISRIEALDVRPDAVTKVIVNERTGTVVMGENVRVSTVAVSHGDLSIEIKTQYLISQPAPFAQKGDTVLQPVERTTVEEGEARLVILPENITLGEVVRALNLVGVTPRDLIAILQAIKAAGALQAEIEII